MTDLADALRPIVAQLVREEMARQHRSPEAPVRLLSMREAADRLGIGRTLVYDLAGHGELRTVTVGQRRRLVPETAIVEYLARRGALPSGEA